MTSDRDQTVMHSANGSLGHPRRLAAFDDFTYGEEQPADVATGLVSLGFVWAAIRRGWRLIFILAAVGLIGGLGYYVKFPPAAKASTSVLLSYGPSESPASAIFDNQMIAESHTVAGLAMKKLGDTRDSLGSFAASYTVTVVTDRVLLISASAPTSAQAVARASTVADVFLTFRADQEIAVQKVQVAALNQEAEQARNTVSILQAQVSALQAQGGSPDKLKSLQDKLQQAEVTAGVIEQTAAGTQAGSSTLQADAGSIVLDPAAPLPASKTKKLVEFALYGLIGGLVVSLAVLAIGAVTSDRLRRRDDVSRALGAPVGLSVGAVKLAGRLPVSRAKRGLEAADDPAVKRIASYLRRLVSPQDRRTALAVIAVDDPAVAALSVVALAMSCAEDGYKVVLADLAEGAPAAALLGAKEPGVRPLRAGTAQVVVAVPDSAEVAPTGPVRPAGRASDGTESEFGVQVASACASANLLLTLVTLDPALGADHLSSWGTSAVAMVTAGKASWTKVHAAGEMIRVAGTRLASTVLVGADKSDETLGITAEPGTLLGVGELS